MKDYHAKFGLYCFYLVYHYVIVMNVMWQVQEPRQFSEFSNVVAVLRL